jgi:hypothetical protein
MVATIVDNPPYIQVHSFFYLDFAHNLDSLENLIRMQERYSFRVPLRSKELYFLG